MYQSSAHIALVVPGLEFGGGVPRVADLMNKAFTGLGYRVTYFDIATSRKNDLSSRILAPNTWLRRPRIVPAFHNANVLRCGTYFAEVEPLRYRSHALLTDVLNGFDLVFIVAGTPSWANIAKEVKAPVLLQVATTTRWERASRDLKSTGLTRPYRRLMTRIASKFDSKGVQIPIHSFALNEAMKSWIEKHSYPDSGVSLLPPAIDTEFFMPTQAWQSRFPIISVGRLGDERKGWDRLFRAYARLLAEDPTAPELQVVGNGTLSGQNQVLIDVLGIRDRVKIYQDASNELLLYLLQSSSVFVQTSHEEGLGLAALEGMACGLPVIATETEGAKGYVIDGVTGYMLDQDDSKLPKAFAEVVSSFLLSDGAQLALNARNHVIQNYSIDRVMRDLNPILERAIIHRV
jgi:glycosyltransferase involved in cell wall biosynthesis